MMPPETPGTAFVDQESFHNYARLVRTYLERFGKPLGLLHGQTRRLSGQPG